MAATDPALDRLTEEQVLAAGTTHPRVYIEAHPGSGKTTVAAQRFGALRYARGRQQPGRGVIAVSFTRAATKELRERVLSSWGPTAVRGAHHIVTLDALVYDLFHDLLAAELLHWPSGHTQLEVLDTWALKLEFFATTLGSALELDDDRVVVKKIRTTRTMYPRREEYAELVGAGVCTHEEIRSLLTQALQLPGVREHMRNRFALSASALVIDEIFDANGLDLELVQIAIEADIPVTVIGDPWQALYGFRGAQPNLVPGVVTGASMSTMPLTRSFRWRTDQQRDLADTLRAGQPVRLERGSSTAASVVLSRDWDSLWETGPHVLPLAFKTMHSNTPYATATLLLNALTMGRFGTNATFLTEAMMTLGIANQAAVTSLDRGLQDILTALSTVGPAAAKGLWPELVRVVKTVAPREIKTNAHANYTVRLEQIARRAREDVVVPGMTVHQAKGREWPVVGVRLSAKDEKALGQGLDPTNEHHRRLYVALTRARNRTLQV